jgi:ribosome recycling factor
MTEELAMMMDEAKDSMNKAIEHLQNQLIKIRAGKASPAMLSGIIVEAYGMQMPINQLANVSVADARTITVQPFDKTTISNIEKGILQANIGLNPQNDGELIRLSIPPLTEERRKELVKQTKGEGEDAKISIRSARKDAMDYIKSLQKDGLSEDLAKKAEDDVQKLTNEYNSKVDKVLEVKEAEIMAV